MDDVLCLIQTEIVEIDYDTQEAWMDLVPNYSFKDRVEKVIPLYNHPHSDKENGQDEIHYHVDSRYLKHSYNTAIRISLPLKNNQRLEMRKLYKVKNHESFKTPIQLISKSVLKHKCIHKGKCPHRGFDLSNVQPVNGVITCPLHSLMFDEKTKKLIESEKAV